MPGQLPHNVSHQEFEEIFFQTKDRLHFFLSKFIHDRAMVEDLLQNCYLQLWKDFDNIQDKENVMALLYTYAKRSAMNVVKKEARRRQIEQQLLPAEPVYMEPRAEIKELEKRVAEAIEKLPERKRMVFRLKREDRLSYHQIAQYMNISINTVENHMVAAVRQLRELILK